MTRAIVFYSDYDEYSYYSAPEKSNVWYYRRRLSALISTHICLGLFLVYTISKNAIQFPVFWISHSSTEELTWTPALLKFYLLPLSPQLSLLFLYRCKMFANLGIPRNDIIQYPFIFFS